MLKKVSLLILFLLMTSCGYESINGKKNMVKYDFSISELKFEGDRNINLKIKEKLNNYTLKQKDKNFVLKIKTSSEKVILARNVSGDPTSFKITVTIFIDTFIKGDIKKILKIEESFNYSNDNNKFDLKKYEREIKNNLAESSSEKLILKLSNIQ
tara:strand:- start:245 stop:709 length:465 start_codon:yes stop_codon:yes gene_type:complete